jgi:hypothetical protein
MPGVEEPHALRLAARAALDREIMLSCLVEALDETGDEGFFGSAHGRALLGARVRAVRLRREAMLQRAEALCTRALSAEIRADARARAR